MTWSQHPLLCSTPVPRQAEHLEPCRHWCDWNRGRAWCWSAVTWDSTWVSQTGFEDGILMWTEWVFSNWMRFFDFDGMWLACCGIFFMGFDGIVWEISGNLTGFVMWCWTEFHGNWMRCLNVILMACNWHVEVSFALRWCSRLTMARCGVQTGRRFGCFTGKIWGIP